MKEIKSRELLKRWQGLIVNNQAIIKAVEYKGKPNVDFTSAIIVSGTDTKGIISNLLKETTEEIDKPFYLSPYSPAHGNYNNGDCCGIFNALNDDLEVICNECGMKLHDLTEELHEKPNNKGDKNV